MTKWLAASLVIGLVGLGLAGFMAFSLAADRSGQVEDARRAAEEEAARAAAEIDGELERSAAVAESLAAELVAARPSSQALESRLRGAMQADEEILTLGVVFDPSRPEAQNSVAVSRGDAASEGLRTERPRKLLTAGEDVYDQAVSEGGGWRRPTWSEVDNSMTVVYSTPWMRPDADGSVAPAGVVFVSVSLDRIRDKVDELDTGALGWGGVLSGEGRYLVHPNEQRLEDPATLLEVLDARGDDEYLAVIESALGGQRVSLQREDTTTGQTAWFFHEPVPQTGWSVVLVRFEDEVVVADKTFRRRVMLIAVWAVIGLIAVSVWLAGTAYSRQPKSSILWVLVGFTSIVLVAGMELVRRVTYDQVSDEDRKAVRILDEDSLSSYVRSRKALWVSRHEAPPVAVPTGLLVRTLTFRGAKEVFVTGIVWQKLNDGSHDAVARGVDLPDAIDYRMVEAYRRPREDGQTVGWRFEATLRQVMDLSRYPLDHDNVAIRLLPKDYDSRVLLVPDLASYTMTNTRSNPGLEETLELSGWSIVGSYFDFKYGAYNTDLGIPDYEGEESLPELHFNIELKRNVLDALIANGIPVLVVLLMLFAIIVKRTENVEESKLFGFNPSGTVRICSALFFVVLLAHIQMRNSIQAEEIVLLEYMYFVVYLAILATALHTFLFFGGSKLRIVTYNESLIVKLLFWPVVLGLQFAIAVALLY